MKQLLSTVIIALCMLASGAALAQPAQAPSADLPRVLYSLQSNAYSFEDGSYNRMVDIPCQVVRDGDVVWFDNLFPNITFPNGDRIWVKGEVDHDIRVTIHPQAVYHLSMDGEMPMEVEFWVAQHIGDAIEDPQDFTDYQFVFNLRDHTIEPIQKGSVLALYIGEGMLDTPVYSAIKDYLIDEVGDQLVTPPAGKPIDTFLYHYTDQSDLQSKTRFCHICIDGTDAYVQGLCPNLPEAWIRGNVIDFGTIALDFGQLLGAYGQEAILYFVGVRKAEGTISKVALAYQAETGGYLMSTEYLVAEATLSLNAWGGYGDIELLPYNGTVPTPSAPWNLQINYTEGTDMPYIAFQYDGKGTEGEWIVSDSLYYQIYVDDQLYTFTPDKYADLSQPLSLINCNYQSEGFEFMTYPNVYGGPALPVFMFHEADSSWRTMGIQLVCQYFGQQTMSQIVNLDNPRAQGIEQISADTPSAISYDLMGRRLTTPAPRQGKSSVMGRLIIGSK